MENVLTANEILWDEQQRARGIRIKAERRVWLKNFALVFALIVLTVAVATALLPLRRPEILSF